MKKFFKSAAFVVAIILGFTLAGSAQIYVSVRPVAPVIVRTAAPSPAHVWIGEDWAYRNGAYVHIGGRWEVPPHPGWVWRPGHWAHDGRGHQWIPGHWRRY